MEIREAFFLRGPNIWANYPVLEAWVDIGRFEELPSDELPGFNERLERWLPSMIEHRCSVGERGGFFQRLRDGTWLGHVLEHVTLELMSLSHLPVGFGRARETTERGVYKVVVRCDEPEFGRAALEAGRNLVLAAAEGREFDVKAALSELHDLADRVCLGPSTRAIVMAARERGIPAVRLSPGNLVQLGYAKAQRRIWTAETDATSAVAEGIAQDKELTRRLLSGVGVPVPSGRSVTNAEDAWAAAEEVGLPVVVKPRDANHGRGVSIRLADRKAVEAAYAFALTEGSGVVVERFISGMQHRVLVVGQSAIAASSGEADQIVGDGKHSVEQLVALLNRDPARGESSSLLLTTLVLDDISLELLRRQGLAPSSVPAAGRAVLLHYNGDLTVDVTDELHPEVAAACVLAAETVGLDIAGVDLIAEELSRPLERTGGAVIEVNASPGLVMHLKPLVGRPRPVGEAIVAHLFSRESSGRVPLVAVAGTCGKTFVTSLVSALLTQSGHQVGCADSRGVHVGVRALSSEPGCHADAVRDLLINPFVDALVFEVAEERVLREGLAFDRCDVAVVTGLAAGDHMGQPFTDLAAISKAVRAAVDVVLPHGHAVLNADEPAVLEMASHTKGKVLLFSLDPAATAVRAQLAAGGRALVLDAGAVWLLEGTKREQLLDLGGLRAETLGLPRHLLTDLLAALGVGVALGLSARTLHSGVQRAMEGESTLALHSGAGALALVAKTRNSTALAAWLESLPGAFSGARTRAAIELLHDLSVSDVEQIVRLADSVFAETHFVAGPEATEIHQYLQGVSQNGTGRPRGQFSNMYDALKKLRSGLRPSDLLFVAPATDAGAMNMSELLEGIGMHRRRMGGLASVGLWR